MKYLTLKTPLNELRSFFILITTNGLLGSAIFINVLSIEKKRYITQSQPQVDKVQPQEDRDKGNVYIQFS